MKTDRDAPTRTEIGPIDATGETAEANQFSCLERYDKRVEEWLASLEDEAGQRSPKVLSALATRRRT